MIAGEVSNGYIVLAVDMRRIAVQPDAFAVFCELCTGSAVELSQRLKGFIYTAANRCYELSLIFTEITCYVLVISERVRSLSEPSVAVYAQSFALDTEFAAEIILACSHIYLLTDQ